MRRAPLRKPNRVSDGGRSVRGHGQPLAESRPPCADTSRPAVRPRAPRARTLNLPTGRTAAGSLRRLGAAHARRRTLAPDILSSARSMLLSLRHPGSARPATPAPGHGQPLAEFRPSCAGTSRPAVRPRAPRARTPNFPIGREAAGSLRRFGAAHAHRRMLAADILSSARSMLLSLRHPGSARPATPAPGHGQPLAESRPPCAGTSRPAVRPRAPRARTLNLPTGRKAAGVLRHDFGPSGRPWLRRAGYPRRRAVGEVRARRRR